MPGFSPEQTDSITATWKKRKWDHEESRTLPRPTTCIPSCRVDRPEYDSSCSLPFSRHPDGADISFRPRCLPRKRRHVQGPYITLPPHQHQLQHQQSPTHLSPNVYGTPNQDPYSPPVSPKTLVPLHHPTQQSASPSALRPCHICHRRPTTRQVLDAYADCDLCHERACFICLRQCDSASCGGTFGLPEDQGMHMHMSLTDDANYDTNEAPRRKICSGCAVEEVTETGAEIVRCLDCVHGAGSWAAASIPSGWALDDMRHEDMTG
ncbi:uncharacterized protein N7479_009889 [Penicillium vulpinum]|uniref:Uncharacterized protein n=1 Tax=Penicillium vulpinum TaxID=29845 RepID=A0A1V6RYG3_9EURO|nr:uncharacterized protein N7479_009889 [Penicillium vulpinum]KAJ5951476.1 hypothetical protein N7479_009889 [Penicillium vulpinum]OQE06524.1 hypothetical protein PENVUL_c017G05089 [Penicillium vulpinum]